MGVFCLIMTAIYCAVQILVQLVYPSQSFADASIYSWSKNMLRLFGIEVEFSGEENIPKEGVLFVFNHASHFDIPIFHSVVRKRARFGAKIELYSIPIFGTALKKIGVLPIARGDREKVLKVYEGSISRVHEGDSFILAAEGTRQPKPGVGEKFKSGPFVFAISGQFPIVPIVIKGAYEILPKTNLFPAWGRWKNPVKVHVLPPVSTKGLKYEDREVLKAQIQEQMTKTFNSL